MITDALGGLPQRDTAARRIYAYQLKLDELIGRIKIGETTRSVQRRVKEQVYTAGLTDVLEILLDEPAVTKDGRLMRDTEVHAAVKRLPGVRPVTGVGGVEWFECTLADVRAAYNSVFEGVELSTVRDRNFTLRPEQTEAVDLADACFTAHTTASETAPRFLWNAKMRFGKTLAAYHLAKKRDARRILVVTYKPAVRASWKEDLETQMAFDGWVFFSRESTIDPTTVGADTPLVCFSSLQDLRGSGEHGSIKAHNKWIHDEKWDLVIVDEYHYGAWNDATKELLQGEEDGGVTEYEDAVGDDEDPDGVQDVSAKLQVTGDAFLCLSGTPFRAIATNEFGEDQIFNWTYTDEQRAKARHANEHPTERNPYGALPQMTLLTYQLPASLQIVALSTKRNEFDLNEFFRATGTGNSAEFAHKDQVQSWLTWLRGQDIGAVVDALGDDLAKPFPYADTNVLPYMNHTVWFLPSVASVYAMRELLAEHQNIPAWGEFTVLAVAGSPAGIGAAALPPVVDAIGSGYDTKTITLTCGKLLTGVTVPQWASILMLSNLESPETYFQAAFRVQSPWSMWNPEGDDPNEERVVKPACLVIDFAPNRALRLYADYGMRLGTGQDADSDVRELGKFLPVLGFDGTRMEATPVDKIIDIAFATTTVDTRRMDSKRFIDANNTKLDALADDARAALARVTRAGGNAGPSDDDEIGVNVTPGLDDPSTGTGDGNERDRESAQHDEELTDDDLAERLRFLAKRINAFMYLSEEIEKNLSDVLATEECDLFKVVMELDPGVVVDLVEVRLFNEQAMRLAIHQFRRADEDAMRYTGLDPRASTRASPVAAETELSEETHG